MLIPGQADLQGTRGATFDYLLALYRDVDQTQAFDLTQVYDPSLIEVQLDGVAVLKPAGGGLIVDATAGTVQLVVDSTVTTTAPDAGYWRLKLVRNDGGVDFAVQGIHRWEDA